MVAFIAIIGLVVLSFLNTLGNFWFTYGVWPRSWVTFSVFLATTLVLNFAFDRVRKELGK